MYVDFLQAHPRHGPLLQGTPELPISHSVLNSTGEQGPGHEGPRTENRGPSEFPQHSRGFESMPYISFPPCLVRKAKIIRAISLAPHQLLTLFQDYAYSSMSAGVVSRVSSTCNPSLTSRKRHIDLVKQAEDGYGKERSQRARLLTLLLLLGVTLHEYSLFIMHHYPIHFLVASKIRGPRFPWALVLFRFPLCWLGPAHLSDLVVLRTTWLGVT